MKKILFSLFAYFILSNYGYSQVTGYNPGDVVEDFTVTDIYGVSHNLYNYTSQGKLVYLDFFFTTCGPCQVTSPIFNEFHEKYGCNGYNVVCLAVNGIGENNTSVETYEETYGGSYSHAPAIASEGGSDQISNAFNIGAYPTYCLIGPDNTLLNHDIWPVSSLIEFEATLPDSIEAKECLLTSQRSIFQKQNTLTIYPNPVPQGSKTFNIQIPEHLYGNIQIDLTDITGKIVFSNTYTQNHYQNKELNVTTDLSQGSYTLNMTTNNELFTKKLIIQ